MTRRAKKFDPAPYRLESGALQSFAWPGGYPLLYITSGADVLCADCATRELADPDSADPIEAADIHYEGAPEFCSGCNAQIESAYGDPDECEDCHEHVNDCTCSDRNDK